jgi:hypothetical protein
MRYRDASRLGLGCRWIVVALLMFGGGTPARAQSLAQMADMGNGVGPRLTRQVALAQFSRKLYGAIGTKVSFIDNGTPYQFTTDPMWGRMIYARKDVWVRGWTGTTGPTLSVPLGIDISARKKIYVAERDRNRVLVNTIDFSNGNVTTSLELNTGGRPVDVAWDGRGAPLTTDYLYVLDDTAGRVSYFDLNGAVPTSPLWTFGSRGTGTGKFQRPSGICVGKSPALGGGTTFAADFYVVDRGNRRVVHLVRTGAGASWLGTVSLPGWDPADCTVDHFGNLYISDSDNSRLHKFSSSLDFLATYGAYGTGANNLGTLDHPNGVSVPCGLKAVNSVQVWYCEGRLIAGERWSDSTGVIEYYIGIGAAVASAADTGYNSAWFEASWTDPTIVTATVQRVGYGEVRQLFADQPYPVGTWGIGWDGMLANGTPAPEGDYIFRLRVVSTYGCPGTSYYPWCYTWLYSSQFHYVYAVPPCDPGGGGGGPLAPKALTTAATSSGPMLAKWPPPPPDCDPDPTNGNNGSAIPTKFAVRQLPGVAPTGPTGLAPIAASGITPTLSASGEPVQGGAVQRGDVARYGVMALQVNAPAAGEVRIEIMSLDGRRVFAYYGNLPGAGMFVFNWDGKDRNGSPVPPGVYMALVRRNGAVVSSRLIVTAPAR